MRIASASVMEMHIPGLEYHPGPPRISPLARILPNQQDIQNRHPIAASPVII